MEGVGWGEWRGNQKDVTVVAVLDLNKGEFEGGGGILEVVGCVWGGCVCGEILEWCVCVCV